MLVLVSILLAIRISVAFIPPYGSVPITFDRSSDGPTPCEALALKSRIRSGLFFQRIATVAENQTAPSIPIAGTLKRTKETRIVLVAGFESFNRDLYYDAAKELDTVIKLTVFSDREISGGFNSETGFNPLFSSAMKEADAFVCSLIFDYNNVLACQSLLPRIQGPRLLFECAPELMQFNRVGSFSMETDDDSPAGPPPVVRAILSKFGSTKEEDRLQGYIKLLKVGPELLKYIPGKKASGLRTWMESYRYWNQGGKQNVNALLRVLANCCSLDRNADSFDATPALKLPEVEVTPDVGLFHPLRRLDPDIEGHASSEFFSSPATYFQWRFSDATLKLAEQRKFKLAPGGSPRVALLIYRKHVITDQRYISDLIKSFEEEGIIPLPFFINGVEAHIIVRELLTSEHEMASTQRQREVSQNAYQTQKAGCVDFIVNTIGFPLVGGPAGSAKAGRNIEVADSLLRSMNVPYVVASPLLLQDISQWKQSGVLGLQSVVLYSLPELDGAIEPLVLGGLSGDKVALVPERVRKLTSRITGWVRLRRTPTRERRIGICLYGFPPHVGAVGTASLLNVPRSLEALLNRLHQEGYDLGGFSEDPDACGESLVAALAILTEESVAFKGASHMKDAVQKRIQRALSGDPSVPATLARQGGGLGGAEIIAANLSWDNLRKMLGNLMTMRLGRAWPETGFCPGRNAFNEFVVAGLQLGNVFLAVQPGLGLEGDPMRLLFERDLTPHPQYCAFYEWMKLAISDGGIGAHALVHLGTHGTLEWLPGQPLGSDAHSWPDRLIGGLPNIYAYASNNPAEGIIAKRRGFATLVSYNVPPLEKAGLYLELAELRQLIDEYYSEESRSLDEDREAIWRASQKCDLLVDVPATAVAIAEGLVATGAKIPVDIDIAGFDIWVGELSQYLFKLQERLFSSGLHVLGEAPTNDDLELYLKAYFGDRLSDENCNDVLLRFQKQKRMSSSFDNAVTALSLPTINRYHVEKAPRNQDLMSKATELVSLLQASTEEMDNVVNALNGGYVPAAQGGDLLRDGPSVLPTGKNIYALDPYRMPSAAAFHRGCRVAQETLRQHLSDTNNNPESSYPETIAVMLWGLDAIKTKGESLAIILALVGATPIRDGTGRIVQYDLVPLEELGRPRVDVLVSLSSIFRDSFGNVVDLLDDLFERAAMAEEPVEMNYIKKHVEELMSQGIMERPAARLFCKPPGDYGSMVDEVIGNGEWNDRETLGEIWKSRNSFSFGRGTGTARPEILDKLLGSTERIVQEIDSVEYGLTDIQEYYGNTGALKVAAAENRKKGKKREVPISVVEAFTSAPLDAPADVEDLEDILRLEYRSKLLNPKWRDAMMKQGSSGVHEISRRFTALVGWAATTGLDGFVFDQAAERYALDKDIAKQLQRSNPEAFKNIVRRLLEASGRGLWSTDVATHDRLQGLYNEADDIVERASSSIPC